MSKVRCVTYTDKFSIQGSSMIDLEVGHQHRMVGCNSSVFGASKRNDIVIITAKDGKKKYAVIGVLKEKLDSCDLWLRRGGHQWKHNYTYVTLTEIFEVTSEVMEEIVRLCDSDPNKPNPKYLFHSRFCGIRYRGVVMELVNYLNN